MSEKMRRDETLSHPYAAENPDNGVVVVQSKAIRKHLYKGCLVFYKKSEQSLLVNVGSSTHVIFNIHAQTIEYYDFRKIQ